MADDPKPSAPTSSNRMKPALRVLLFASLALNLVVAGLAAGVMLRDGPGHPPKRGGADYVIPYTRAFDDAQRKAVWRSLRRDFAERRKDEDAGKGVIAGYQDALAVLTTEPFDEAAMMAVLEQQTARASERQATGQRVLTEQLKALSAKERAAYAKRLAREIEKLEERRDRWRSDRR
ncbi:periplasmic heavy metal sensor [Pacificoceanicola onchidii]|uniref:periplasmic heavy metal sensor n=1 Tax=Pacificoceanicola onchidii TaxID=2562685 RepID=UPI0010A5224A|nr:periplasmic heavy metal sensor [Pacificoceanicola onchidii]